MKILIIILIILAAIAISVSAVPTLVDSVVPESTPHHRLTQDSDADRGAFDATAHASSTPATTDYAAWGTARGPFASVLQLLRLAISYPLKLAHGATNVNRLKSLAPLPTLNINTKKISISGLSSGADFSSQFAVAYSKTIMGLGVFAGVPWNCQDTYFGGSDTLIPVGTGNGTSNCDNCPPGKTVAIGHCRTKNSRDYLNSTLLAEKARAKAAEGQIDDTKNLHTTKIYTYCGTKDEQHTQGATVATHDFFAEFAPPANVLGKFDIPSGHAWPQDGGTVIKCGSKHRPLQNCGYDGPGVMLNHIYGKLKPPTKHINSLHLHEFNQLPFNGNDEQEIGLGRRGLIYVPESCAKGTVKCALHVAMHGCKTEWSVEFYQAKDLSYNRWAETNDIVVLWPHNVKHGTPGTKASKGCWDSYGQTGSVYDLKSGPQMMAIREMIETVAGFKME